MPRALNTITHSPGGLAPVVYDNRASAFEEELTGEEEPMLMTHFYKAHLPCGSAVALNGYESVCVGGGQS